MGLCGDLLEQWCERLLTLQIKDTAIPSLKGGIMCPACARIHGRCFDAIHPFLYLADKNKDLRYLEGAKLLFDWAENTVSREDGSYVNDVNAEWKGTTVFSVIQLIESLKNHGHLLDSATYERWKDRIKKAAGFLYGFKEFEVCNINYRITNGLAMSLCGEFLDEKSYLRRGKELIESAMENFSPEGILFGEGRPVSGISKRGCRPVDIGYNIEESLPSLIQYGHISGQKEVWSLAVKALKRHLLFMLSDGGIDNSFGTRNYKWTYWGSRTSDGCALGYLLAAEEEPEFGAAAYKNLKLLKACTHGGFLYGGPHVYEIGEPPCIHHGLCHGKVLAGILDQGLEERLWDGRLPRMALKKPVYVPETDTFLVTRNGYTATVTGYDWEYPGLKGGHAGGGSLTLLWQRKAGLLLCAGMSVYSMKEPNNMQLPRFERHECLTPRVQYREEHRVYESLYDRNSSMVCEEEGEAVVLHVEGRTGTMDQEYPLSGRGRYRIRYEFLPDRLAVSIKTEKNARLVLPIISKKGEPVSLESGCLKIRKEQKEICLKTGKGQLLLPYGTERIYSLVPGVEALKTVLLPEDGTIAFCFSF